MSCRFAHLAAFLIAAAPAAQQPPQPTLTLPAFTGFAHPDPEAMRRRKDGEVGRCEGALVFYVHFATAGELALRLERTAAGEAAPTKPKWLTIVAAIAGDLATKNTSATTDLGTFRITAPGYHKILLSTTDGEPLRDLRALHLSGTAAAGAQASTTERRNAASVHLGYTVPQAHAGDVEWFYCEVTPRTDPLWTYYMATGWQRGYFGIQVNSPTERRVIFSVWDAGSEAKDRSKVAADDRVQLVAKGDGVVAEGFGNEGTGGHSHLVHDWKLGETFRFLVHAARDGTHTTYTGWFWLHATQQWGPIASFRAPRDEQGLRGLYSFNENFSGANGDLLRECEFGNVWARTRQGEWLALREAHFTHDGHGKRERLDRSAFARDGRFVLQNGGFLQAAEGAVTAAHARLAAGGATGQHPADAGMPKPPAAAASGR